MRGLHKEARLNVRLTKREHRSIENAAMRACMSMSDYVRTRCLPELDSRVRIDVSTEDLRKLLVSQKRATTLLNQGIHALNRGSRYPGLESELKQAIEATSIAMDSTAGFLEEARRSV